MGNRVHQEILPNGLGVLAREVHVAPVAEIQVWARVGSADEGVSEAGLAHFHEHMLFKGTDRRGVGEVAGQVEGAGGHINAFTSFDVTCYHATLPSDAWPLGLEVLADAAQHSVFDPEEVSREIDVVLEEIRRSEDDPHSVLSDALFAEAYRVHPYRAPILGSRESVASISRERLQAFYRRWYTPDNLVVVAAGDFDTAELLKQVRAAFASPGGTRPERTRAPEPPQTALRTCVVGRPFERACLDLSWASVGLGHPDAAFLDLLAFVLGEGDSSRLVRRVREEQGLADRIDASSYTPLDAGLFGASADADPAQVLDVVAAVVQETETLRREAIREEELAKARANFLAMRSWERESVSGIARKLGSFHLVAGDYRAEEAYLERVRTATPEDLLRVAARYLAPERLTAAVVCSQKDAESLGDAGLAKAVERGVVAAARVFQAPARNRRPEPIREYALRDGARLFVLPRREVPVVAVRAALLGGQLAETEQTAGLSSFLASMWVRGSRAYSAADFASRVEALAADVDGFSGRNSVGLTLDATADRFEAVLDLFAAALLQPTFAAEEIERERRETQAALTRRADRPAAHVFELFSRAHWERHPYRHPLPGLPENVARFDPEALGALQRQLVTAGNLTLAVVGDVDPDAAAAAVARRLGELPKGPGLEASLPELEAAPQRARFVEETKDRAQAHLVLGFRGLTVQDPDREALEVLAQLLGGQGGRLFLELRDRRGLAYTVSAVNVEGIAPGLFAVYMGTAPEKLEAALDGIRSELQRVLESAPREAELARARRYLVGSNAIDQQRSSSRALHMALDARYGLGPDAEERAIERIRRVSAEDVLRVAQRVLDLDCATLAVIHP